ncbi:hypothetical protein [Paraburkholderia heleia]|uniref:hypothetical protein n=1 Tax=Paraburkholderia heleia TaxID=634127 RepID=UPI002AB67895|nr:hypothetical protein [Paraburkholderia heleia]
MNIDARIQITPSVIFSAAVFTPVELTQRPSVQDRDTQQPDSHRPAVDPRQIELWANDANCAPQADAQP